MQVRTGSDCALREKVASGIKGIPTGRVLDFVATGPRKDRFGLSAEGERLETRCTVVT